MKKENDFNPLVESGNNRPSQPFGKRLQHIPPKE